MNSDAQERSQARSIVITRQGIVAASQTLAAQAGAQVLARGGSAADAAIAANVVLGVVEPMSDGIGGDLFAIYWDAKTGRLTGLNASGWAPRALTIEFLNKSGHSEMPQLGIHTVTVPGCVDGWRKLHGKFGKLPWHELFRPAFYYAEHGFPVTEIIQAHWRDNLEKLTADPNARSVFLTDGKPPQVGEWFRNPQLAGALRMLALGGPEAFTHGLIAKAILQTSARLGGTMVAEDLIEFQSEWVDPVSTEYRGWKVYELPPNGQGIAALEMLNILENLPLDRCQPLSAEAFHLKIEAQKLAYQDLRRYNGDPRFAEIPLAGLISKAYGARRAALIDPEKAQCHAAPGDPRSPVGQVPDLPCNGGQVGDLPHRGDTVYLTAVDRDGNIVSLIQSIFKSFGSGIAVEGMGFHLHNRGALFVLDPHHPNALAPRKRPFHTIIPAFMEKRRSAHRLRHHGRREPGAGARAIRL